MHRLLSLTLALLVTASSAHAQDGPSRLALSPAHPVPGATVQATYVPGDALRDADAVDLRGRLRSADDAPYGRGADTRTLGRLDRQPDGSFRGSVVVPDSVVFALLAVADADGSAVDANLQLGWPLLTAESPSGDPAVEAYEQYLQDLTGRDWRTGLRVAREFVADHPDDPRAHSFLWFYENQNLAAAAADSAAAARPAEVARLDRVLSAQARPDPAAVASLAFNARYTAEDTTLADRWEGWLRAFPTPHPEAVKVRTLDAFSAPSAGERLRHFEDAWPGPDAAPEVLLDAAFGVASASGDRETALRWADRRDRVHPYNAVRTARALADRDDTRAEGLARLERLAQAAGASPDNHRHLFATVAEHRRRRATAEAHRLADLGTAYLAAGDSSQALDALDRASAHVWSAPFFQSLASLRLATGDSVRAADALARAVTETSADADSLRARGRALVGGDEWSALRADADADLRARTLKGAVSFAVDPGTTVLDASGDRVDLGRALADGSPTVVAFVSRYCKGSRDDTPTIQALADRLAPDGVRVLAVTDERPSDGAVRELTDLGLRIPVLFDADNEASLAFSNAGTPNLFVVDGSGRVRFEHVRDIDSVPTLLDALSQGEGR